MDVCKQCKKNFKYNLDNIIIVPFEIEDEELKKLFSFFLYTAPTIKSMHSFNLPLKSHDQVYYEMMEERHFKTALFCASNADLEEKLRSVNLNGAEICIPCKRIGCKRKKINSNVDERKESDLECLLRHLRNAIAHGRVYCQQCGKRNWIVFEDRNETGKLSARIVCLKADLKQWKKVLGKHSLGRK